MARDGAPEGTVVTALTQTRGRGRRGRKWSDSPGESAILSAVLRPSIPSERWGELSFVASLAIAKCLESEGCGEVALKWPNDVLLGGRKVCGILVETSGGAAVVGIGLNVNQREFPQEIRESATSVMLQTGAARDVRCTVDSLARGLFSRYEAYVVRGFEEIRRHWEKYMWGAGRLVEVVGEGYHLRGRMTGVDPSGALVIADGEGKRHNVVAADDVRYL